MTPAVMCMLESLAASETGVSWLAKRRTVEVKKPVLVKNDGAYMLSFTEVVPVSSKKQERLHSRSHPVDLCYPLINLEGRIFRNVWRIRPLL